MKQKILAQQYSIKKYGVLDGLGQSQVQAIAQDSLGYLWVATLGGGLSRFDGTNFVNFGKKDGLASNFVLSLEISTKGELFIGTAYGLSKIVEDSMYSNFTKSALDTLKIQHLALPFVATNAGIYKLEGSKVSKIDTKTPKCSEDISQILMQKNILWAATSKGVMQLSDAENRCRTDLNAVHNNVFSSLLLDHQNSLWIGSNGGGITVFTKKGEKLNYSKSNGLNTYNVLCLFEDSKHRIWIGSDGQGLSKFENGQFTQIRSQNGLSNDKVNCVFEDKDGYIWFGTSNGLSKFEGEKYVLYDQTSFIPNGGVYSIFQSSDSSYWAGTLGGGIVHFDKKAHVYYNSYNGFTSANVKSIFESEDGKLWIATDGQGLFTYEKGKFKNAGIGRLWISDIEESKSDSCLFLATLGQGIIRLKNDEATRISVSGNAKSNRVNQLISGKEGLYLATDKGAYLYKKDSIYEIPNLPKERFTSLAIRPNGTVFFANIGKGIFVLKNGKITNWTEANGLSSDNIYALHLDGNNLWVGTEKGLDVLSLDEQNQIVSIEKHNTASGFMGIEIMRNCIFKDVEQNYWFGTVNGLVKYSPLESITENAKRVVLQSVELFYKPLSKSGVSGLNLQLLKNEFEYNQNHFTFRFQGISSSSKTLEYRWRLVGLDEIWSPASTQTFATYANLASGKYTFEVQTRIQDGIWSSTSSQEIKIKQAFWETTWFKLLGIASILILLGLIIWAIIRYFNKKNKAQIEQQETKRRIVELEQQALRLQMNPHFLFNSLNAIKGAVAQQETKEAKRAIDQFAKLMRLLLENTHEGYVLLSKEISLIEQYLSLELLNHRFTYTIEVSDKVPETCYVPAMMIQPMVENAVLHGVSPLKDGGEINVKITLLSPELLLCEIADNGIGREASKKAKENSIHKSESRAIGILESRLELIKNPNSAARIEVIDKLEQKGTIVKLYLPLKLEL